MMIEPALPAPATIASLEDLNAIIEALSKYFLMLEDRQTLATGAGVFVFAAEYESDGSPLIGYRFTAGQHVADVAAALDAYKPPSEQSEQ